MVLMYHDVYIDKPEESGFNSKGANCYKMDIKLFKKHLQFIKNNAPETILTFDDGGVSFYTLIAPALEEYGLIGHFYIATDYIGNNGFMNEYQISELHRRGHIIGAHSSSHPSKMTSLPVEVRRMEWEKSIFTLSRIIGTKIKEVSIPNGFYQKEDLDILFEVGINTIYTSSLIDKRNVGDLHICGRIALMKDSDIRKLKNYLINPIYYSAVLTKQVILQLIKKILGDKYIEIKKKIRK
ncbi:polysaccharide deacetylase family protein [Bacteroides pyogenes]|uniref:polysaccharide deacetylase family protein n=1 Tax=Bacteroides pyogenes TaxID=310300 RepID=UPI001BAA2968|nr:polysaccharide deacetylase family protein [Bacteroides pyogenes]MBR8724380.1 hypothetical protein [Bacteroides pyogenes]MBR8737771.1 hypothetical protein [Bacteroides pyogenes]MBR8753456.1 hypothetical protein [Bacteroides pyogenes]MBR8794870.1 hypothetical protein [Bacteroides pyogenes]MBR8808393.1 hypothetical protein [Bacteroides pyogenes]